MIALRDPDDADAFAARRDFGIAFRALNLVLRPRDEIARLGVAAVVEVEGAVVAAHEREADPVAEVLAVGLHRRREIAPCRRVIAFGMLVRRVGAVGRLGQLAFLFLTSFQTTQRFSAANG